MHTNQHHNYLTSAVFSSKLFITESDAHLGTGLGSNAEQTALALSVTEKELIKNKLDYVIVHEDVNSTISVALVATRLNVPVIHIESGRRSFYDSGGVQYETCFYNTPRITVRLSTEHPIIIKYVNRLINIDNIPEDYFSDNFIKSTLMEWYRNSCE